MLYRLYCALLQPRVKIGRGLKIGGRLSIKGPGRVTLGEGVEIGMTVTLYTHHAAAHIKIGDHTFLNGTRFGCSQSIQVGKNCILADCRLMDTDFHSVHPRRRNDPDCIKSLPIVIGDNVWITAQCIVLKGSVLGTNSTVTPNSVVNSQIAESCIAGGNPAKLIRQLREDELS